MCGLPMVSEGPSAKKDSSLFLLLPVGLRECNCKRKAGSAVKLFLIPVLPGVRGLGCIGTHARNLQVEQ